MARPLRIEYPGAWYHVMNRGAGSRCIFPNEDARRTFLQLLSDVYDRFTLHCHAYCLMGNHYHLLVHTPNAGLGRAMRHLDGVYTQRHNRLLETDGPLFRGRYKSQLVEDGEYLWAVSRYVHRNPVEAGLCKAPATYPWSSYRYFAGERGAPVWLQQHVTLQHFDGRRAYCAFVETQSTDTSPVLLSEPDGEPCPPIIGSDEFIQAQRESLETDDEIPDSKDRRESPPVIGVVDALCAARGWQRQALAAASDKLQRRRRALIMTAVYKYTPARLTQIADAFDMHYSAAANAIHRLSNVPDIAAELGELRRLLRKMF